MEREARAVPGERRAQGDESAAIATGDHPDAVRADAECGGQSIASVLRLGPFVQLRVSNAVALVPVMTGRPAQTLALRTTCGCSVLTSDVIVSSYLH